MDFDTFLPVLFWLRFVVEGVFALVFWLAALFAVVVGILQLATRNRQG